MTVELTTTKKEINARFLAGLDGFPNRIHKQLLDHFKSDIETDGWTYALRNWAPFLGFDLATIDRIKESINHQEAVRDYARRLNENP